MTLLAAAVWVSGGSAQAEPAPRKPTVVSGTATSAAGVLTASAAGADIELPSRAHLRLSPNAVLRVFPVPQALQLATGPKTTTWSFALQSGRVDIEQPRSGRSAVLASIGKLSAVVTSGHVAVLADHDEATVVNIESEARTLLSEHWQALQSGFFATLNRDNPSATPKQALPSPTLNDGQRMWVSPSEAVSMRGFRWTPVPGAERYELRLRRLSDGKVVDLRSTTQNGWSDPLTPVEPGKYALNLRSVDDRGVEGSWSADAELRVIGVVIPPGGFSSDQAIFLGMGQHVQFTNTSGLEMTYLGAGRYFPAANGASLYRNSTTVIGFRIPGVLDTAVARLEPRGIYADVQIGPKRALWPRDSISIDIQLKSRTLAEVPAFVHAVPTVTVGLDPVEVTFEQTGNTLHAVVPPSTKPGPWVLRVDVADQYGVPLGHDFLEVATHAEPKAPAVRVVMSAEKHPSPSGSGRSRRPAAEPIVASSD